MHKVIVEEPRHGGARTKRHRRDALPFDMLPSREGMRRPHVDRKWFGEHLGPLKRWLRSKVGQRWNDVYSEACSVIKPNDVVRLHIRTHMMEFVERHTFMRNGEVWYYAGSQEMPVTSLYSPTAWPKFYVHPQTGILHEGRQWRKERYRWRPDRSELDAVRKWIRKDLAVVKLETLWFAGEMRPYALAPNIPPFDAIVKLRIAEAHAHELYGRAVYCASKRQLSRQELKKLGLVNSPHPRGLLQAVEPGLMRRIQGANGNPVRDRLQDTIVF